MRSSVLACRVSNAAFSGLRISIDEKVRPLERVVAGDQGRRLAVERRGIVGIGDGRRQIGLYQRRGLKARLHRLGGDGVVDRQKRAVGHHRCHPAEARQADHGPPPGHGCAVGRGLPARDRDPHAPDERRQQERDRGGEGIGGVWLRAGREEPRQGYRGNEQQHGDQPRRERQQAGEPRRPRRRGGERRRPEEAGSEDEQPEQRESH